MKKLVFILFFFVLVSVGNARQFAQCLSSHCYPDKLSNCYKHKSNGKIIEIKNVKTTSQMYAKGWRLIFVNTGYFEKNRDNDNAQGCFHHFEK